MRDPNRIFPFCNKLAAAWRSYYPDLRFWQFVCLVVSCMENDCHKQDPFFAEEKDWEMALERLAADFGLKTTRISG